MTYGKLSQAAQSTIAENDDQMRHRDLREQNRRSWDAMVPAHYSHHHDLAGFLHGGGLTIFPEERELLGELGGCTLTHLMCNTGQDLLSLAQLGAATTGVDISAAAIEIARRLAVEALREYPYVNGKRPFEDLRALPGRRMAPPETVPATPLMYGVAAQKTGD